MSDDHEHAPSNLEITEQALVAINAELVASLAFGTTPGIAGVLAVVGTGALARFKAKGERHVTSIAKDVGIGRFQEVMETDPEREALFINSLQVAMLTADERKRIYLARVVSQAFKDDALVSDAILITEALRQLDGPHIRALAKIVVADDKNQKNPGHSDEILQAELETHKPPLLAALVRAGVVYVGSEQRVRESGLFSVPRAKTYSISGVNQFGHDLLDDLESIDLSDAGG